MPTRKPVAAYPFTQAELWKRCLDLQPALDRDATELAARGVTAARIAAFKADTRSFGTLEPDAVLVQEGAIITEQKTAGQASLETAMQQVMALVAVRDSPRTGRYKRFGVRDVSSLGEAGLFLGAALLVKQGRKYLPEYAVEGLTEAMLQTVEACSAAFLAGLAERKEAENTRSTATETRLAFANRLYAQLVQLCAAGEALYRHTDAVRARQYVVQPSGGAAGRSGAGVAPA
ncbi:hypothetical protein [Hymenobacter sp. B81]|uniref:hypothetical protein n=1 Tax=Hymenobacter sp. B81 TaxID=3344878 RepID=UPI0037DC46A3